MSTSEPTWQCPHCKTIYNLAQQDYCSCKGPCATWFKDLPVASPEPKPIQIVEVAPAQNKAKVEYPIENRYEEINSENKALIVNLLGGPNDCVSMQSGIVEYLVSRGINCKYVTETPWHRDQFTAENQIFTFAEYQRSILQLSQQTDVIITNGTILLSALYDKRKNESFRRLVMEDYNSMWNYNIVLIPENFGAASEVKMFNREIVNYLLDNRIVFETAINDIIGQEKITDQILRLLPG